MLRNVLANLHELADNPEASYGTPTGFSGVDRLLVGMGDSDLIILGARPGMGKTSFALNIATNVAIAQQKAVCVFSLETSAEQLVSRLRSSEAMVESYALRSGQLSQDDWKKIADAAMRLSNTNLYIDDTSGMTVTAMKAKLPDFMIPGILRQVEMMPLTKNGKIDRKALDAMEVRRAK